MRRSPFQFGFSTVNNECFVILSIDANDDISCKRFATCNRNAMHAIMRLNDFNSIICCSKMGKVHRGTGCRVAPVFRISPLPSEV